MERRLGLAFNDPRLLRSALTHRSFMNEALVPDAEDNERLEFLGDALLDFVAGDFLYRELPEAREGDLTALRSALVCEPMLARFALDLDLGAHIRLGRGEAASGGSARPALLCDAFEALLGAIYLDQGFQAAEMLVLGFFRRELPVLLEGRWRKDAKSRLQELTQRLWQITPRYVTVSEQGPDHLKHFIVEARVGDRSWGSGAGPSKSAAAREAALEAIESIRDAAALDEG